MQCVWCWAGNHSAIECDAFSHITATRFLHELQPNLNSPNSPPCLLTRRMLVNQGQHAAAHDGHKLVVHLLQRLRLLQLLPAQGCGLEAGKGGS